MSSKVPKDQAVLQKEEGCQEGSLNDAAMSAESGKKFAVRLDCRVFGCDGGHVVDPSAILYSFFGKLERLGDRVLSFNDAHCRVSTVLLLRVPLQAQSHPSEAWMNWKSMHTTEDKEILKNLYSVREKLKEDIQNKSGPDSSSYST